MLRNCPVGGRAIVGTIGGDFFYFFFDLRQQWPHLGRVVSILVGEDLRDYRATGGIDRQMQLAPRPARLRAMFCFQPLAGTEDFKAGTVDQHI